MANLEHAGGVDASASPPRRHDDPRFALLRDIPDGITVQDARGTLVFANDPAARMCGFSDAHEMVSAPIDSWLGRLEMRDEEGAPLSPADLPGRSVSSTTPSVDRLVCFDAAGAERWAWVSARAVHGSDPPLVINTFRDATTTVRAERRAAEELRLSRALLNIAFAISSEPDRDKLAARITQELSGVCRAKIAAFLVRDSKTGEINLLHASSDAAREMLADRDACNALLAPLWSGQWLRRADVRADAQLAAFAAIRKDVVSFLAVPISTLRGDSIGALVLADDTVDHFHSVHERAAVAIASHAAVALESAASRTNRENERERERIARHAYVRADVGAALAAPTDLRAMLQACCEAIVRKLEMSFARVWLVDDAGETLELQASAGKYTHIDGGHARVPVGAFKIGKIAAELEPHITNDVQHDPRVGDREWAKREGMVAFAGYPLVANGKLLGVVAAFSTSPLPQDTVVALGGIGDAIAQGVARRRAEIALQEHAKELARSNADLEQFAYVASHDLQEPLRMVTSYVQLLSRRYKDQLDPDARDFIGFAVEGVSRMRQLIEDLLAYSRIGTRGKEPTQVDLEDVMTTVRKNLATSMAESNAEIVSDPLPSVLGDPVQLTQLLQNLLSNAIKFHGEAPPRVKVHARRDAQFHVISVEDNGIGIDAEYFERIFVIFQRLNLRETYPGTGIGLAVAKRIVERHGGKIWVESTVGRGTTISFSIPSQPRLRRSTP